MEVVASLSQGRTAAARCGLFTYKSVPVIFEPPCISTTKVNGLIFRNVVTATCCAIYCTFFLFSVLSAILN